jgi:hypothetical protein
VKELNAKIDAFLKDTEAVVPKANPTFGQQPKADAVGGWVASKDAKVEAKDGVFVVTSTGGDPYISSREVVKGVGRFTVEFRMKSDSKGGGQVFWATADEKLTEDTLVAFISDNGGPTMKATSVNGSVNTPLRGSKRTTLEGGVRVPFLVSWPGEVTPGTDDRPVIQLDLHATDLAADGVTPKAEWKLEGVDLLPYLSGKEKGTPHDALYWRFGKQMAVRQGDWKLVRYDLGAEGKSGLSDAKLYNLMDDIGEATDLSAKHLDKVKALQAAWDASDKSNVAPLWGGDVVK